MVVGFTWLSDSDIAGNSIGKPPAWKTPRFTSSTRCRKWAWQGLASDQVLRMAITGRPAQSSGAYPICIMRERCPDERRSSGTNQRALRNRPAVFAITNLRQACSSTLMHYCGKMNFVVSCAP